MMYQCEYCKTRHEEWTPNCPKCGGPLKVPKGTFYLHRPRCPRYSLPVDEILPEDPKGWGEWFSEYAFVDALNHTPSGKAPPAEDFRIEPYEEIDEDRGCFAERHPNLDRVGQALSIAILVAAMSLLILQALA